MWNRYVLRMFHRRFQDMHKKILIDAIVISKAFFPSRNTRREYSRNVSIYFELIHTNRPKCIQFLDSRLHFNNVMVHLLMWNREAPTTIFC